MLAAVASNSIISWWRWRAVLVVVAAVVFCFLAIFVPPSSGANCSISLGEFSALEDIYNTMNGTNWDWVKTTHVENVPWNWTQANVSSPCSDSWYGVSCEYDNIPVNTSCYVKILDLTEVGMAGTLPSSISNLTRLSSLQLRRNFIVGSLASEIFAITTLKTLRLSHNLLTSSIPSAISQLVNILYISLGENYFDGPIPSQMSSLTNLEVIKLEFNSISGSIPSQLSHMTKCTSLILEYNSLTGTIPPQLSALTAVTFLQLNNNNFNGLLPSVLSSMSNLTLFDVSANSLNGDVPDIFESFSNLQYLDLCMNNFAGLLPPSLKYLGANLQFMDVARNNFHGYPFFFLDFPHIKFVNLSSNNFDDISALRDSEAPVAAHNLSVLDISKNKFQGSLPESIGVLFPHLKILIASNNCFDSRIPGSLCNLKSLITVLLNQLGSECSSTTMDNSVNTFAGSDFKLSYTIPDCLLTLPVLQTAHMVSNSLYGTLGEISATLKSLSVVGNLLTGAIPTSIQQSSNLNYLQLSLNRLSGTLIDEAFKYMSADSRIDLNSNRISGNIPSGINHISASSGTLNMIQGNLFNCSKPPINDENYENYVCGTSSIDFYLYVYISIIFVIVSWAVWVFSFRRIVEKDGKKFIFVQYFELSGRFPGRHCKDLVTPQFILASVLVAVVTSCLNLGLGGDNPASTTAHADDFQRSYITHQFQYGWSSSFTYVHGLLPFFLVFFSLSIMLFVYLHYNDFGHKIIYVNVNEDITRGSSISISGRSSSISFSRSRSSSVEAIRDFFFSLNPNSRSTSRSDGGASLGVNSDSIRLKNQRERSSEGGGSILPSELQQQPGRTASGGSNGSGGGRRVLYKSDDEYLEQDQKLGVKRLMWYQFINVVIVTGVNVLYILLQTTTSKGSAFSMSDSSKKILPIALSIFKLVWNFTFVMSIFKYGIYMKFSISVIFANYIFAAVYNFVLVPIVTVYFTDVSCFYYPVFGNIPGILETYNSFATDVTCFFNKNGAFQSCSLEYTTTYLTELLYPSWIYSYQCGFEILVNYVPAVIAMYTINGFIMPAFRLMLIALPPDSYLRNSMIAKMNVPYCSNHMEIDKDDFRKFRTLRYLGVLIIDILMLFTYGIFCPFLALLILFSIIVNEVVIHIQVGSCVYDKRQEIERIGQNYSSAVFIYQNALQLEKLEDEIDKIQNHKFYLDNRIFKPLYYSMWKPMLVVILLFMSQILFDIVADVYTNEIGVVAVVCFCVVITLCFNSKGRLERMLSYIKLNRQSRVEEEGQGEGGGEVSSNGSSRLRVDSMNKIEMVDNPIIQNNTNTNSNSNN